MSRRGPAIHLPPPLYFVAGIAAGLGLERLAPLPLIPEALRVGAGLAGRLLVAAGIVVILSGMIAFIRARTTMIPNRAASRLVAAGPYRFTRNPMYLGFAVIFLGIVLITDSPWMLLLFPVVILVVSRLVIVREERYLRVEFGDAYADYCARVRRWI